jgi:hypothetical protein
MVRRGETHGELNNLQPYSGDESSAVIPPVNIC